LIGNQRLQRDYTIDWNFRFMINLRMENARSM